MSLQDLNRFGAIVHGDAELRKKLSDAKSAKELVQRAVRLAAARGLEFTPEELQTQLDRTRSTVGELSDGQLDAVAGGAASSDYSLLWAALAIADSLGQALK